MNLNFIIRFIKFLPQDFFPVKIDDFKNGRAYFPGNVTLTIPEAGLGMMVIFGSVLRLSIPTKKAKHGPL